MDRVLSLLGLAMKAGKIASGEFASESAVKDGSAKLVIIAKDASKNTQKLFKDKTSFRNIPLFEYSDKESLGRCIGKEMRSSIAVTDEGFAKKLSLVLSGGNDIENT